MSTQPQKTLSIIHKFLALLLLFLTLVVMDAVLLLHKSEGVEHYDVLNHRLDTLKSDIIKFEYVLDIFLVTRQFQGGFEEQRVEEIGREVEKVDERVMELLEATLVEGFRDKPVISSALKSIGEDWEVIRKEASGLNADVGYDKALLIHNAVDMNTFLLTENIEKLLDVTSRERAAVFQGSRDFTVRLMGLSALVLLVAGMVFLVRVLLPVSEVFSSAERVFPFSSSTTEEGERFREDLPGEAGSFARAMNDVAARVEESRALIEIKAREAAAESERMAGRAAALNTVTSAVGSSLSLGEIFTAAAKEMERVAGTHGAAVYLKEDGVLKLKHSKGLKGASFRVGAEIPLAERTGGEWERPRVLSGLDGYSEGMSKSALVSQGVGSLVSVPIPHGGSHIGFMDVIFMERVEVGESDLAFFEAVASNLGVAAGYSAIFHEEHVRKRFLERVITQTPCGFAAFDGDGRCTLANDMFKRLIGGSDDSDLVGNYSVLEEDFMGEEFSSSVKSSYAGRVVEAEINGGYGRLVVKSYP
ncbi:MAG: GAF domain-containing protein, partial [Thermodesulfobacteriota bacterium]